MKESNPIEVVKFAVAKKFDNEVAFTWWVPYKLNKMDRIIIDVNTRDKKSYAIRIDKAIGNTYQKDAIDKEMYNVWVGFGLLDDRTKPPSG